MLYMYYLLRVRLGGGVLKLLFEMITCGEIVSSIRLLRVDFCWRFLRLGLIVSLNISSDMWSSEMFIGLVSGRSRLYILDKWICRRMGEFELVDSAIICWYGLPPKESPEADLAPGVV